MHCTPSDAVFFDLTPWRTTMINRWYEDITATGFTPCSHKTLSTHLEALGDQVIALLRTEVWDQEAAEAVGVALAALHVLQPEVLSSIQTTLTHTIMPQIPAHLANTFYPRLIRLSNALAVGFYRHAQQIILTEQEAARQAYVADLWDMHIREQADNQKLHLILSHSPLILFSLNQIGIFIFAEGKGLAALGYTSDDIVGESIFTISQNYLQILHCFHQALAGENAVTQITVKHATLECHYTPMYDAHNTITGVIGIAIDITARMRTEQERSVIRRKLSDHLETERQRIARDLHDNPVQQLLGVTYQIAALRQRVRDDLSSTPLQSTITSALTTLQQDLLHTITQIRWVIQELRPLGLYQHGLSTALNEYICSLQDDPHQVIILDVQPMQGSMSPSLAHGLFRVVQESVQNARRHAQASQIYVNLYQHGENVTLTVSDNGCGFHVPESLYVLAQGGRFGLIGITEHVHLMGGWVTIQSQPGAGTIVTVDISLEN